MARGIFRLVKALVRRTALDDLLLSIAVASWTLRLLQLTARSPGERRFANGLAGVLEEARTMIQDL